MKKLFLISMLCLSVATAKDINPRYREFFDKGNIVTLEDGLLFVVTGRDQVSKDVFKNMIEGVVCVGIVYSQDKVKDVKFDEVVILNKHMKQGYKIKITPQDCINNDSLERSEKDDFFYDRVEFY